MAVTETVATAKPMVSPWQQPTVRVVLGCKHVTPYGSFDSYNMLFTRVTLLRLLYVWFDHTLFRIDFMRTLHGLYHASRVHVVKSQGRAKVTKCWNISVEVNDKALNYLPSPSLSYKYHLTLLKFSNLNPTTKIFRMACSLPHTDSEIEALVQRLINEDKGRQDVLLDLAFQFEDSCAVRDDLRKTYEKCNDISQESRALICTLLKESSEKDRKLHLSMYGKAARLEKQMGG
ncbi:hypothetical protein Tco_1029773 [Tanacetum coccineum]|uniref:Uncharacterized protein n=1 Tax=Tanacetum coccineum TaxID=301880 RepID=A0ABQ5G4D1_9ASTR